MIALLIALVLLLAATTFVLACPFILVAVLRPALQCVDGGSRKPSHVVAAFAGLVADVVAARTTWPLLAGPLHPGEKTISDSLERLCGPGWEWHPSRELFVTIGHEINKRSPTGRHIKVLSL